MTPTTSSAQADSKHKPQSDDRWRKNRWHWETVVDPANLSDSRRSVNFRRQIELYRTADVRMAIRSFGGVRDKRVLDLGGGNGLAAVLLIQRGARPVIVDISLPRLLLARRQLFALGFGNSVDFVLASADRLPLADGSIDGVFAKSTLIHVPLDATARELGRVLDPRGRAAIIEPQRLNPFVNLYRRFAAPKEWRAITTYFGPAEWEMLRRGLESGERLDPTHRPKRGHRIRPWFFLGFFASALIFAFPNPKAYRWAERLTVAIDNALFKISPRIRRRAWFGLFLYRR